MRALIIIIVGNIASRAWVVGSSDDMVDVKRGNTIRSTTILRIPLKISLVLLFLAIDITTFRFG